MGLFSKVRVKVSLQLLCSAQRLVPPSLELLLSFMERKRLVHDGEQAEEGGVPQVLVNGKRHLTLQYDAAQGGYASCLLEACMLQPGYFLFVPMLRHAQQSSEWFVPKFLVTLAVE
ncbi:hypothetical protein EON64_19635 [archaeon]|nr:MAG: hypothetical protein EON64_19635 [archaeon]